MGFSSIIDILGSVLVGGILLLILFRTTDAASENTYNNGEDLIAQQNITVVVSILENDFRLIGYCNNYQKISGKTTILYADTSSIKFLTDVNNNSNIDSVYYYVGPTSELNSTTNPRDRLLYRVVDGETPKSINLGITEFKLEYFNTFGQKLSTPVASTKQINSIKVSIKVEDTEPRIDQYGHPYYVNVFWQQLTFSTNLIYR